MKKVLIAASLLVPFISFAHDGHGEHSGFTITHYFVEPGHAVYTWSFIVVGLLLVRYFKGKKVSK
jgi:hypothetical protein